MLNQEKNTNINENDVEVDLIALVKTLWNYKLTIFLSTIFIVLITSIISFNLPKQFQSKTTFHIHQESNSKSNLMNYANLLGINNSTNIESIVSSLLKSKKIKTAIAKKYQYLYEKDIQLLISKNKLKNKEAHILNYVVNQLKLSKNLSYSKSKEGLITLLYFSPDPNKSRDILLSYLTLLEQFNKDLQISVEKNLFTIIDHPEAALFPFKPNILIHIIIGFIFGIFISSIFLLIYDMFKFKKSQKNS